MLKSTEWKPILGFAMESSNRNVTVREKFRDAVYRFFKLEDSPERRDLEPFQKKVGALIQEFLVIESIVNNLSLFSSGERLKEIHTPYLPFAGTSYYTATLYMKLLADISNGFAYNQEDRLEYKSKNLQVAKTKFATFLVQLETFGGVLSPEQVKRIDSFKSTYDPSTEEITTYGGNAATRRAEKISNFKLQKELREKLKILEDYYKTGNEEDEEDIFRTLDEEIVRGIFVDLLTLYSFYAFDNLELVAMELQVLENRPPSRAPKEAADPDLREKKDDFGYTTRLEENPFKKKNISDLISKQGKILQPFVITNGRQDIQRKVFGTGQVLPSMSVEEYLDYELANGKMVKEETKDSTPDTDEELYDSDAEYEKRAWDDWKDDNPKGSGNMKANIG